MKPPASSLLVLLGMVLLLALCPAQAASQGNVLLNGDFASGCDHWSFQDISYPYQPGDHPYCNLDCTQGAATFDVFGMEGYGLLWQSVPLRTPTAAQPVTASFDYQYSLFSEAAVVLKLHRGVPLNPETPGNVSMMVEVGSGAFNRVVVTIGSTIVLQVTGVVPMSGSARLDLTPTQVTAFINGHAVGTGTAPSGSDLSFDTFALMAADTWRQLVREVCDNAFLSASASAEQYQISVDHYDPSQALTTGFTFRGTVTDTRGIPAADLPLGLDDPVGLICRGATTDALGRFSFDIPAEAPSEAKTYLFTFYTPNYGTMASVPVSYHAPQLVTEGQINAAIRARPELTNRVGTARFAPELAYTALTPPVAINIPWAGDPPPAMNWTTHNSEDDFLRQADAYDHWARTHNLETITVIENSPGDLAAYNHAHDIGVLHWQHSFEYKYLQHLEEKRPYMAIHAFAAGVGLLTGPPTWEVTWAPLFIDLTEPAARVLVEDAIRNGSLPCATEPIVDFVDLGLQLVVGSAYTKALVTAPLTLSLSTETMSSLVLGMWSALHTKSWCSVTKDNKLSSAGFEGVTWDGVPFNVTVATPYTTILRAEGHSPIWLKLIDSAGREVGLGDDGIVLGIPRAHYSGPNDMVQTLSLIDPEDSNYGLIVHAIRPGDFRVVVKYLTWGRADSVTVSGVATPGGDVALGLALRQGRIRVGRWCAGQVQICAPRGAGFWSGGRLTADALSRVATCVGAQSRFFDWRGGQELAGLQGAVAPPRPMDVRKQAIRQFACLVANVCAWENCICARDGSAVGLNPLAAPGCRALGTSSVGEAMFAADSMLVALEGKPLSSRCVRAAYEAVAACAEGLNEGGGCETRNVMTPRGTAEGDEPNLSALDVRWLGPRPNPTAGSIDVAYDLALSGSVSVRIDVYDVAGRRMRTLVDGAQSTGHHDVTWACDDVQGRRVASGIYFVRASLNGRIYTSRVLVTH